MPTTNIPSPKAPSAKTPIEFELRFAQADIERRFSLPIGRLTNPHWFTGALLAFVLLMVLYSSSWVTRTTEPWGPTAWRWLTSFQGIPIAIAILSCWACSILLLKLVKIRGQRRVLQVQLLPKDSLWVLDGGSADQLIRKISVEVEEAESFMYLRRVLGVLRTMRNVGRVADVEELFESRAGADEAIVDSGYAPVKAFIWGVPVLGFIGTVIGLTQATGRFGAVLNDEAMKKDLDKLAGGLTDVLSGLDTAFITTAEGLIAAFFLYLFQMIVKQADDRLLDDVREACSIRIVTRVRIIPSQAN